MTEFSLDSLLAHRLLVVSGKGGTGKTTVSLALGLLASARGKRVLIAEIHSEEQISHILECPPLGHKETSLLPGLWGINILPQKSFEEYVLLQIKFRSLYRAVFENRMVRYFIEATPGLADLMSIGKVYALADSYDLVIVDAPATGHGMALLEIPGVVSRAVRLGPLKTESDKIERLLHDPEKTETVLVTLPEEMPVMEALETGRRLKDKMNLSLGPVFLNQFQKSLFKDREKAELESFKKRRGPEDPLWRKIELQMEQACRSQDYLNRLSEELKGHPLISLPFIYSHHFGLTEIEALAGEIEKRSRP